MQSDNPTESYIPANPVSRRRAQEHVGAVDLITARRKKCAHSFTYLRRSFFANRLTRRDLRECIVYMFRAALSAICMENVDTIAQRA